MIADVLEAYAWLAHSYARVDGFYELAGTIFKHPKVQQRRCYLAVSGAAVVGASLAWAGAKLFTPSRQVQASTFVASS